MPSHFSLKLAVKLSELKISKKSLRWHTTINSPIDLHTKLGQFEGLWLDPGVGSGYELYITGKLTTWLFMAFTISHTTSTEFLS